MIQLNNWQTLCVQEADLQGCDRDIALATVDAETGGNNIIGDSGNALGFGQVWPKWHNDSFQYAADRLGIVLPADMTELTNLTINNNQFSMAVAVHTIKKYWLANSKDFRNFTLNYVGPKIPDSDYQRRLNIWNQYHNNSGGSTSQLVNATNSYSTEYQIPATNYGTVKNSKTKGDYLFGRKCRVIVGLNGNNALDVSDLRISFNVAKTMLMQPNYSEVVIYNLNAQTENSIIKQGFRVIIEAGYEGNNYGLVFDGDVIQPIREKEDGTTYKLILRSLDGDRFLMSGFVNFSVARGQTSRDVIQNCSNKAKVPSQLGAISEGLKETKLTRGKVVFGMAKDYLRQVAKGEQATFYVENGKVNIVKATDLPKNTVIDLSPASGLIGVPTQTEFGISGRCLLNPRIQPNTFIHIDNSLIRAREIEQGQIYRELDKDGLYRVIAVNHVGDTRGNDWYTEFETITQAGVLPGMIANGEYNPF